jgi:hypothetical protein
MLIIEQAGEKYATVLLYHLHLEPLANQGFAIIKTLQNFIYIHTTDSKSVQRYFIASPIAASQCYPRES